MEKFQKWHSDMNSFEKDRKIKRREGMGREEVRRR
jgi:hypothetical protein